ncbi:MAG: NAD(P)H-binding protein [Herpetosiphonaceae bacterium]|nr:NAD(P)H-binding protein [Herpetosiphonaceae bacterium]
MKLTVLGASGATGHQLTRQALERGHSVTAIARDPSRIAVPDSDRLKCVGADVRDPQAIVQALAGSTTVLSGLGVAKGDKPGVLTAGARAVVAAKPERIIWLGAIGTGASAVAAGLLTRILLRMFLGAELEDKVTADTIVLTAGGTVFHAGPLTNESLSPTRRTATLDILPWRIFPSSVSRATVAAAMLDEAERQHHVGQTVVPLG